MGQQRHAFGSFVLDPGRGELLREGRPVALGQRALALLQLLLDAEGEPVSKDVLLREAWPGAIVEEVNLTVQVAALRKALGTMPDGREWIVTVPRLGYRLPRAAPDPTPPGHSGPAAIAVLPFDNLGSDPEQGYFADGLAEDIITALSRFKSFAVLARNSSFAYRDRAIDIREAGRELGVRYILEGSVRRLGESIRVSAQLIDAGTGMHLWAEKFDGTIAGMLDFQDRVTDAVTGVIEPEMRRAEIERARRKRPENLEAYDLYLRALPRMYEHEEDGYQATIGLLERAIELEPEFAAAVATAAWAYEKRSTNGFADLHPDPDRAVNLARQAVRIGVDDPQVLAICGIVLMVKGGDSVRAMELSRLAMAANPNNVIVLNLGGICNVIAGDLDIAEAAFRRILQLAPGSQEAAEATSGIGQVRLYKGDPEAALPWIERAMATGREWPPNYWHLVAVYVALGRMEEAQDAIRRMRIAFPAMTLTTLRPSMRIGILMDSLEAAGLPEN